MALSYARLFDTEFQDQKYKDEQLLLYDAIKQYPDMIAGDGRLDTRINSKTQPGNILGKWEHGISVSIYTLKDLVLP